MNANKCRIETNRKQNAIKSAFQRENPKKINDHFSRNSSGHSVHGDMEI